MEGTGVIKNAFVSYKRLSPKIASAWVWHVMSTMDSKSSVVRWLQPTPLEIPITSFIKGVPYIPTKNLMRFLLGSRNRKIFMVGSIYRLNLIDHITLENSSIFVRTHYVYEYRWERIVLYRMVFIFCHRAKWWKRIKLCTRTMIASIRQQIDSVQN